MVWVHFLEATGILSNKKKIILELELLFRSLVIIDLDADYNDVSQLGQHNPKMLKPTL